MYLWLVQFWPCTWWEYIDFPVGICLKDMFETAHPNSVITFFYHYGNILHLSVNGVHYWRSWCYKTWRWYNVQKIVCHEWHHICMNPVIFSSMSHLSLSLLSEKMSLSAQVHLRLKWINSYSIIHIAKRMKMFKFEILCLNQKMSVKKRHLTLS